MNYENLTKVATYLLAHVQQVRIEPGFETTDVKDFVLTYAQLSRDCGVATPQSVAYYLNRLDQYKEADVAKLDCFVVAKRTGRPSTTKYADVAAWRLLVLAAVRY